MVLNVILFGMGRAGMIHYNNLINSSNYNLKYIVDINDVSLSTEMSGKSHRELLRRLHVIEDGNIYSGVKAFIVMWDKIPKYRWASKLITLPAIYHISVIIYEIIAYVLFLKNKHQLNEKK